MPIPDYDAFFGEYASAYERSLGQAVDSKAIRGFFAEEFIAASMTESTKTGKNDGSFERILEDGFAFYRSIGTQSMKVVRVQTDSLCEGHDRARVFYSARYKAPDGREIEISFDVTYLIQRRQSGPKIFGFISGDEMTLFKQHGLVADYSPPGIGAASGA